MTAHSTITAKGQTTVPKEIRDRLKLKPGDRIEYVVEADGRITLKAKNRRMADFAGILGKPPGGPLTIEEMDDAIAAAVTERYERSKR
ncbi:MAG: type II toxin-antitoxin system PrlF family antitoxin [Anderseniella sp.]|jgi:AbrB family looped-hinge helix DNA binding protein|nr:type II toxin-antitoxin system PrlF family antitoxin [Anderseniella sp.]